MGANINYAGWIHGNHLRVVSRQLQSHYTFDTVNTTKVVRRTGPLNTNENATGSSRAKVITKPDDIRLIGEAYCIENAQLPEVIPTLEPNVCATKLTAITPKHTFKQLTGGKPKTLSYETHCTIPMQFWSCSAPSHVLVMTISGATSLIWHSCPVTQDSRPEAPEIRLASPRTTRQSNRSGLI